MRRRNMTAGPAIPPKQTVGASSSSSYEHHESITLAPLLLPSSSSSRNANANANPDANVKKAKLGIDVAIETYSSLGISPTAALDHNAGSAAAGGATAATPFPAHIVDLMLSHNLEGLLLQVSGSSSASSSSSSSAAARAWEAQHQFGPRRGTSPAGTSVYAKFAPNARGGGGNKFESLLRSIAGSRLVCAPLVSVHINKNPHMMYPLLSGVLSDDDSKVDYSFSSHGSLDSNAAAGLGGDEHHVVLPPESGHLCTEGLSSFTALLTPCRNRVGVFASSSSSGSLSSSGGDSSSSSGRKDDGLASLSALLLGSAPNSRSGSRSELWIELRADGDGCFDNNGVRDGGSNDLHCTVSIHQGVMYGVEIDANPTNATSESDDDGAAVSFSSSFSLVDVLPTGGGIVTKGNAKSNNRLSRCPLADTSVVRTVLPPSSSSTGSEIRTTKVWFVHPFDDSASTTTDGNATSDVAVPSSAPVAGNKMGYEYTGTSNVITHDLQSLQFHAGSGDGGIAMGKKWMGMVMKLVAEGGNSRRSSSGANDDSSGVSPARQIHQYSAGRTILRPKGVANAGTFLTGYRNGLAVGDVVADAAESSSRACDATAAAAAIVRTMDVYPKVVAPIFHTMTVKLYRGGGAGDPTFVPPLPSSNEQSCDTMTTTTTELTLPDLPGYRLVLDDNGSTSLQLTAELPPDSSLWVAVDYEPKFLPFEDFPSDPNRGVDVPPSYGTFSPMPALCGDYMFNLTTATSAYGTAADNGHDIRLYTPSVLIMPPVPDMSMPFNVISLTCTIYAFVLGSMVNFLVRKSNQSVSDAYTREKPKSRLAKIKGKFMDKFDRLMSKRFKRREGEEGEEEGVVAGGRQGGDGKGN